MSAQTKISRASMKLMLDHAFYSALTLRMKLEQNEKLATTPSGDKTMSTDGVNIYWSEDFVNKTSEEHLMGVLAHEGLHMGLGHHARRDDRDPSLFNIACDLSINHILKESGLNLPADAITLDTIRPHLKGKIKPEIIEKLPSMNAEKIYTYLEAAAEKIKVACPVKWGGVSDAPGLTSENKGEMQAQADEALQSAAAQAEMTAQGKIPGSLEALIKKMREPKVDWRSVMWRFTTGEHPFDYSYRRPNRHYVDDGFYLPSIDKIGVGVVAVLVDTSGSVSSEALSQFLGEINSISTTVQPEKIYVIPVDYVVHEKHIAIYERGDEVRKLDAAGRGGTSFIPGFKWLADNDVRPDRIIYLTDLMGDFPEDPQIPTLWVSVVPGHKAPFGETVYINVG